MFFSWHLLSNYSMYICLRLRTNSFIAEKEFWDAETLEYEKKPNSGYLLLVYITILKEHHLRLQTEHNLHFLNIV